MVNPRLAVYRGECQSDGLAELDCAAGVGSLWLDVEGLTPGAVYFLRVASAGTAANAGTFQLCVREMPPVLTIDQGGSALCSGTLYDTGGPDGDYQPNEDHTFVICPDAPAACIEFVLEYYQLDAGDPFSPGLDVLSFYDGPNTDAPLVAQINGLLLGVGMDGGGGVCFKVQAKSGCLTVQFQSDAADQYRGFKGHWQCSAKPCVPPDDISVEAFVPSSDIADVIAAPGTVITVQDISHCPPGAYGVFTFASDNNELGLRQGLLLTTGLAELAVGPNNDGGVSFPHSAPGDADLDYLSAIEGNGLLSEDACAIELDVFVAADELAFEYVFGSEEHPEFANSPYNDIFAFFVSGPGIAGDPNLSGAVNIAVLPGTNTPVQINSVNNLVNWEYFRNTETSQTLQYDGLTSDFLGTKKSLTARVDVVPCNTYRLKLAIADREDPLFDSGVFISEVRAGAPEIELQIADSLDYLTENCSSGRSRLLVRLRKPKSKATAYTLTLGGSATPGVDYETNIPPTVVFSPGDSLFVFFIDPIADTLWEGKETITVSISSDFGCGSTIFQTLEVALVDGIRLNINDGVDTLFFCVGAAVPLQVSGAESYAWSPPSLVSDPNAADPIAAPVGDTVLWVVGTLGPCIDTAEVFLRQILQPQISIAALDTQLCVGDTVLLSAQVFPPEIPVTWTPQARLSHPSSAVTFAYPLNTTTYTAAVQAVGCSPASASIVLAVEDVAFPLLRADTTLCQGVPIVLASSNWPIGSPIGNYRWEPAQGLNNANIPNPTATPQQTTTYVVTATGLAGICTRQDSVTIAVIPAEVRIEGPRSAQLCLGDSVRLQASASPPGAVIQWEDLSGVLPPVAGNTVTFYPEVSTVIYAAYSINGCVARDSVWVQVDSLPPLALEVAPLKELYCPGDTLQLLSAAYSPAAFPGITHQWEPFAGMLSPLNSWNMAVVATETHVFRRLTRSQTGACQGEASVVVRVGESPQLSATVAPPAICPGQTATIQLEVEPPGQAVLWEDPTGTLSCAECLNPVASPAETTTYRVSTPGAVCPRTLAVSVAVWPLPALDLTPRTICLGDSLQLNRVAADPADTYVWAVVPPGDPNSLSSPNTPSPAVYPAATTTYRVSVEGRCPRTGEVTVTVNSAVLDVGPDQVICAGTAVVLHAEVTTSPGVSGAVVWEPGTIPGASVSVSPTATTTYTAAFVFPPDCRASDSLTVEVLPGVALGEIRSDVPVDPYVCEGRLLTLRVDVQPPEVALTWLENGQPLANAVADSLVRRQVAGADPVSYLVVAENAEGCRDTSAPFEVLVRRCLAFPNAFTPDGDGYNDVFGEPIAFGEGAIEVRDLRIFNRWGELIFATSPAQKTWDGNANGRPAPSEVYVYAAVVRFANGEEQTFTGEVTLLR